MLRISKLVKISYGTRSPSYGLLCMKPDGQLKVFLVADCSQKLGQHWIHTVVQLQDLMIEILRHFQTFFVEDNEALKSEGMSGLEFLGVNRRREDIWFKVSKGFLKYLVQTDNERIRDFKELIWELFRHKLRPMVKVRKRCFYRVTVNP